MSVGLPQLLSLAQVLISSSWVIILFTINAIVSGIMIFRDYFDSYRSATVRSLSLSGLLLFIAGIDNALWKAPSDERAYLQVFLTNIALMFTIMERTLQHSWAGLQDRIALSCIGMVLFAYSIVLLRQADTHASAGFCRFHSP